MNRDGFRLIWINYNLIQCFRYGWDDPYEYDETAAAYEYEGWYQDPETGRWELDPAVRDYYEKLGVEIPDPNVTLQQHDNSSSGARKDSVKNSNVAPVTDNKNVTDSSVNDLNKKNRVSSISSSSDNYFIPYGDKSRTADHPQADSLNNIQHKRSVSATGPGSKDGSKNMLSIQPRPKPPDYDEAWYEDPTDGQWYNQYDWYEDEMGEWVYDYRMEEYGYIQNELGEWVPIDEAQDNVSVPTVPLLSKQSSIPGPGSGQPSTDKKELSQSGIVEKFPSTELVNTNSGSEKSLNKSLPKKPSDYDEFWYQTEDGKWHNEYDDMGIQFANDGSTKPPSNIKNVPKHEENQRLGENWYQDEFGVLRNKLDDDKLEDSDDYYTEEQLTQIEADLKKESIVNQSKTDLNKAVEPKQSVIEVSKSSDQALTEPKAVKPLVLDDQDSEDVDKDEAGHPASILSLSTRRDSPLTKKEQKVSFEKSDSLASSGKSRTSGKSPRERWLWAYTRIVQVGRLQLLFLNIIAL